MSPKLLIQSILVPMMFGFFISCSRPEPANRFNENSEMGKFDDPLMRQIHDYKNNRNTAELVLFLSDKNPAYRAEAAFALASVQDSSSVEALFAGLKDEAPEVRMMSAFALGQLRIASVAEELIELINRDTTTVVRTEALEALGKTGSELAAVYLSDYEPRYFFDESGKAWGIYQLGLQRKASTQHASQMASFLNADYDETRLAAAHFFSRFVINLELKSLERLLNMAATDQSPEVRMAAAKALGNYPLQEREKVLRALIIYDEDPGVRVNSIKAMQQAKILSEVEVIYQALDDGNPNVALSAAEFFMQFATKNDSKRLTQKAIVSASSQIQASIYSAVLRVSDEQPNVSAQIKKLIRAASNEHNKAALIRALKHDPRNRLYLDSIVFSGNKITSTAALETIHEQLKLFGGTNDLKLILMERVLNQGDAGLLSYAGVMLRDELMGYKELFKDYAVINNHLQRLNIPEDLEAWVELNNARAFLSGEESKPKPDLAYSEINWELIQSLPAGTKATVLTTKGSFELLLLVEDAPATVSYFVDLVNKGYYNNKPLHRVVPNFVIQTGCPRGDGYGSSSPLLRSEFSPLHYGAGVAGIASVGKDTESCQWFVTHSTSPHLDGRYSIFAAVVGGMEVIQQIEVGDKIEKIELAQ